MLRSLTRAAAALVVLVGLLLAGAPAHAAGPLDRLPGGMRMGIYSPSGDAAAERAGGRFGLRTLYITSGFGGWDPTSVRAWLDESRAARMVPVMTYYQLQPVAPSGDTEITQVAASLRDPGTMARYWADVRKAMQVAGQDPQQLVIFHIEPDGWQYIEQLQGLDTRAIVGSSGAPELAGLPDDARGFAQAFERLRDRYAPNVALAFHLSSWGVGQSGVGSVANSKQVAHLRARFVSELGAHFDLALHDPPRTAWTPTTFTRELALLRTFHADTGLPLMLFQTYADRRVSFLLGRGAAARARLRAQRRAGVVGVLWDAGTPQDPAPQRTGLFRLASQAVADGRLR